jgi:hypothetical protein
VFFVFDCHWHDANIGDRAQTLHHIVLFLLMKYWASMPKPSGSRWEIASKAGLLVKVLSLTIIIPFVCVVCTTEEALSVPWPSKWKRYFILFTVHHTYVRQNGTTRPLELAQSGPVPVGRTFHSKIPSVPVVVDYEPSPPFGCTSGLVLPFVSAGNFVWSSEIPSALATFGSCSKMAEIMSW